MRSVRYCTFFGGSHLRMFNGESQTTTDFGAKPLVDNRLGVILKTSSEICKIKILSRPSHFKSRVSRIVVIVNNTGRFRINVN